MAEEHDEALDEVAGDGDSKRLQEVHDRALRRFDATVLPQQEIRAHALLARRFISIPGAQWEGDWGDQFENSPRVEIDKLSKGVDKIVTDYRQNRIVPDFRPAGGDSNSDTADTLDGIHRADSYHFKAQQARDNAFEEAVAGGMGAWRLTNEWADPCDKDSDHQRINPGMLIADADQRVFFDGNSKLYDKRDARFCFVLTADTRDAFEEEYGENLSDWPDPKLALSAFDWFTPNVVIKAEYYEVEERDEKLLILTHKLSKEERRLWASEMEANELRDLRAQGWESRTRNVKRRRVHKYLLSGAEVLKDQGFIAGDCIPIVPVYGKRWFVDNQERFRGHVSKRMDAQRMYNAEISRTAETAIMSPRQVPLVAPEQLTGNMPDQWAGSNINRLPFLFINPLLDPITGAIVSAGPVGKIEPPQLDPSSAALLQIAASDLADDDPQADEVKANVSADAMDIAAQRVDAKSGIYLDNMRQSVEREGEIYLSMAREVYCEEGRSVETMSEEGDDGEATLAEPYTDKQGRHGIRNDFSRGKYKVIADVTEATATRRDKAVRAALHIATVAQAAGDEELAQVATLTAVMNQDGEGTSDFQRYARKKLVVMGVVEPTDDEKKQMEEAQQQQQPDPTAAVAAADVELKGAKAGEAKASTLLKMAQAQAVGGPEKEPQVPSGLEAAATAADITKKAAEAEHIRTQTAHLPEQLQIEGHNAVTNRLKAMHSTPLIRRGSEMVQ